MKILIVSTPVFKLPLVNYGGLEHLAWLTAKGLAEKGHQVDLVAPNGSTCPGVTIIPIGEQQTVDERMAFNVYSGRLASYEVIIDESWQKYTYLAKAQGLRTPVLGVCHAPVNSMYNVLPPNVDKPCFVCISQDQANHFEALFSRKAEVAHNGIDLDFYKPLGYQRNDRFLFLARFSTIKSPLLAIRACKEVGACLDLVGDTSITNEPEYFQQCKRECDGEQIRMVGPATRAETVHWYSRNHVLLHPNKSFREPFGLAPGPECQSCGMGTIAWDYGAMRETMLPGVTGLLVKTEEELKDAIREAMKPNSFFHTNRQLMRDWASQFSARNMVDNYERLSLKAIQGGGW